MLGKLNTTLVERGGWMVCTLHETDIVKWKWDRIVLNHGGWVTNTTKRRMNQCSEDFNLGFSVYSRLGTMWVTFKGKDHEMIGEEFIILREEA